MYLEAERKIPLVTHQHCGPWILSGFQYHFWNGLLVPYLRIKQEDTLCYIPFFGVKHFLLSNQTYCTSCLQPAEETSWTGWCPTCQELPFNKQLGCIFTQAGHPFNALCDPLGRPLCEDEGFCERYCQAEYVVYLGRFGICSKVGITRRYNGDAPTGYFSRIMDQGFNEILVFRGMTPLNLLWAQELEQELAQHFSIPSKMGFRDKYDALTQETTYTTQVPQFSTLATDVQNAFPELVVLDHVTFDRDFWDILSAQNPESDFHLKLPIKRNLDTITGDIILARGELALLSSTTMIYWINLRDLQGRSYYQGEA